MDSTYDINPEAALWTKVLNTQETINDDSPQREGAESSGMEFPNAVNILSEIAHLFFE